MVEEEPNCKIENSYRKQRRNIDISGFKDDRLEQASWCEDERSNTQENLSNDEKTEVQNFDPSENTEIDLEPDFDTYVDKPDEENISCHVPQQISCPRLLEFIQMYNNENPSMKILPYGNLSRDEKSRISNFASTIELEEVIVWEQDHSNMTASLDSFFANNKWMLEDTNKFQIIDRYQRNISYSKEKNKQLYTINSVNEESI